MAKRAGFQDRYLVSFAQGAAAQGGPTGIARKFIWESASPLELGHRAGSLERGDGGLRLRLKEGVRELPDELFEGGKDVELPVGNPAGLAVLTLKRAPRLRPAYAAQYLSPSEKHASRLRISSGTRGLFSAFHELSRKNIGRAGGRPVFVLRKNKKGYELKARQNDLHVRFDGGPGRCLKRKEKLVLSEHEVESLSLGWQLHWWSLGRVVERPLVELSQAAPTQSELESQWLRQLNKKLLIGAAAAALVLLVLPKSLVSVQPEPPEEPALVELKKPRVIEKVVLHPAAPKPVLLQPKHVAAAAAPKRPAKPQKIAQKPPVVLPLPVPRVDPAVERAKQTAAAQAQLAKSLNFLSATSPSKAIVTSDSPNARYKAVTGAVPRDNGAPEVLSKLAAAKTPEGPIETQGARTMGSQISLGGRKTLNDVQGQVSASALAASGSPGSSVSSLLSGKGMSVSGEGALAQSEIEQALSKHLQRFQYCYEKALLSDPSLAGHVLIQWTIGKDGDASDVKVLRSQLNQPALHQCLSAEIARVHFPAPKGGAVQVKYPFAFSSTAM